MESDYKEMKENVEFAASEHSVLGEELKEAQAALEQERSKWAGEQDRYESELKCKKDEAVQRLAAVQAALDRERSDRQRDKEKYEGQLAEKEETLQRLAAKFARNRDVWLANETKANDEIRKLDNIIDNIVSALSDVVHISDQCPRLKRLYDELTSRRENGDENFHSEQIHQSNNQLHLNNHNGGNHHPPSVATILQQNGSDKLSMLLHSSKR